MDKACENCAYLVKDGDNLTCQVTTPGKTTEVDEKDRCPKWESKSLKCHARPTKRKKIDLIIYEIVK